MDAFYIETHLIPRQREEPHCVGLSSWGKERDAGKQRQSRGTSEDTALQIPAVRSNLLAAEKRLLIYVTVFITACYWIFINLIQQSICICII